MPLLQFIKWSGRFTLFVAVGLFVLAGAQQIPESFLPGAVYLVLFFSLLNFVASRLFKVPDTIVHYSIGKLPSFFPGIVLGGVLYIPALVVLYNNGLLSNMPAFKAGALAGTFLIILWEELWFRNVILTDVRSLRQQLPASAYAGVLFLAVHFLNPEFDLLSQGWDVFIGGASLSLLFMMYKSFWLPAGLHFANNVLSSKADAIVRGQLTGAEEVILTHGSTILLTLVYLLLAVKVLRSTRAGS